MGYLLCMYCQLLIMAVIDMHICSLYECTNNNCYAAYHVFIACKTKLHLTAINRTYQWFLLYIVFLDTFIDLGQAALDHTNDVPQWIMLYLLIHGLTLGSVYFISLYLWTHQYWLQNVTTMHFNSILTLVIEQKSIFTESNRTNICFCQ